MLEPRFLGTTMEWVFYPPEALAGANGRAIAMRAATEAHLTGEIDACLEALPEVFADLECVGHHRTCGEQFQRYLLELI
jgi:hypothetical protein